MDVSVQLLVVCKKEKKYRCCPDYVTNTYQMLLFEKQFTMASSRSEGGKGGINHLPIPVKRRREKCLVSFGGCSNLTES